MNRTRATYETKTSLLSISRSLKAHNVFQLSPLISSSNPSNLYTANSSNV